MTGKKKLVIGGAVATALVSAAVVWIFYMPIYKAQNLVKKSLIDPESARFSEVKYVRETGAVCGLVNGKNKMGGYVGEKPFFVTKEGKVNIEPAVNKKEPKEPEIRMPEISISISNPSAAIGAFSRWESDANRQLARYKEEADAYSAELKVRLAYLEEAAKNCEPE
jgi:hypothetical protein